MEDPEGGGMPQLDGAQMALRGPGKKSRRRKGKRSGNARPPLDAASQGLAETGQPRARPMDSDSDKPPAKRKRRRAGKAVFAAAPAVQPGADPIAKNNAAKGESAAQAEGQTSRKSRRRHRGKRGLQGRPLVQGDHPAHGSPNRQRNDLAGASKGMSTAMAGGAGEAQGPGYAGRGAGHDATAARAPQPGRGHPQGRGHPSGRGHSGGPQSGQQSGQTGHQPGSQTGHPTGQRGAEGERRREHYSNDALYAALDLGTNNCRLLIAQPTRPGQFRVVDAFSRIVRLGEGLAASGRLSEEAMTRAVEALRICASKLKTRDIRKMRLIATEACRRAENGEAFLERVREETGLVLEIIDRETEARLAVSGCASLVGREARSVVLFDIGGGSSEIAVIRLGENRERRLANHITHWTSLPVGVVTLSERHGGRDVTPQSFEGMVSEVSGMLDSFECPVIEAGGEGDFHLIGTSGTVTTLAGVHLDLPRYDRRKVDGIWLSDDEVTAMQAKLLSWDFDSRAANPCIGPDRADLVLAGCAILEAIRRRWPSPRMRVADRGLREGLLADMMGDDGAWRRFRPRRAGQPSTGRGEQDRSQQGRSEKDRS